jgi:hypothetical protein
MLSKKYNANVDKIQELLTGFCKEVERSSDFVERRSKIDGPNFTQIMVFGCIKKPESSLGDLVKVANQLEIDITPPGLDQRINKEAVLMLMEILQRSMQELSGQNRLAIELLKYFTAVYLLDSTQVALPDALRYLFPGAGGDGPEASVKIQLSYDYLRGVLSALRFTAGIEPDQSCELHLEQAQPGSLHLFDLGYFKQQVFAELDERGSYFISRFAHQTALYTDEAEPIRVMLLDYLQKLKVDQFETRLQMGRISHLPVRILFQRLPLAVVEERRRKAIEQMKEKGRKPSDTYLQLLEWQFFITNIPMEWLSFDQILLLYRVRWQVELVFKLWKSQANLDGLGNWRVDRVLVHIYARLIGLVLFFALTAPFRWLSGKELSLPKAFASFQDQINPILEAICNGWASFYLIISRLSAQWRKFDLKTRRVARPSTLEALNSASS